jgi:predicted ATPase with chaperone activity
LCRWHRAARDRQQQRFAGQNSHIVCNADMTPAEVRVFCKLDATGQSLMRAQSTAFGDAATPTFRTCVPSRPQNRADDCGPGGQ